MKISDILTDESKWCKNGNALDVEGNLVSCVDTRACRWCLFGVVAKVYGNDFKYSIIVKINKAIKELYPESVIVDNLGLLIRFNDRLDTTFDMIRKVVEHAGV